MKNQSAYVLILLAFASFSMAQKPSDRTSRSNFVPQPSDVREVPRPATLHVLTLRLNDSFQQVSQARDAKGFVHNRALLKEHTANLKALHKGIKLQLNAPAPSGSGNLQDISSLLHETTEAFFDFEQANDQPGDPNIVVTMDVRESFALHTKYMNQLTAKVAEAE